MPSLSSAAKSKSKNKDSRTSRSRNTTPSSVVSANVPSSGIPSTTPFLELDTSKLLVPPHPQYAEILERLESKPPNLEPRNLQEIIDQLKQLSDFAEKRAESCEKAIRVIHDQLKDLESEQKERERADADHARRQQKPKREDSQSQKNVKAKKRKERPGSVEHVEIKKEEDVPRSKANRALGTPGPVDSPSPSKKIKHSPGTSSLSDVAESPKRTSEHQSSPERTDVSMDEGEEEIPVKRAPPAPPQGFFPDPLAPDSIIYHIRDVQPDMDDEEKKEIYGVTAFPHTDLSDQIAGVPPDKDFSNAKPTSQIAANTFLTFVEPYVRPLAEEDMAFLRERGDRVTPFLSVARGKKHYNDIWAEEDGISSDHKERPSTTQARGNIDQIEENNVDTDHVSTGPLASRLLSLLKFEHRSPSYDATNELNAFNDGNDTMDLDGLTNGNENSEKPQPPATAVAELAGSKTSSHRLDYVQSDERIKSELRYLGLLGQDENPDFDAHNDDDISERLRMLQTELRRVMITNGARKARLLDQAKERLAYQEYITIHEDLDSQVQQAYLKRTRTLGKSKKGGSGANKPKAGLASAAGAGFGSNRARDIGDNARMLMDRRKRWQNCIGPVFKDMKHGIPGKEESLWDPKTLEPYEKAEMEALEDEGE